MTTSQTPNFCITRNQGFQMKLANGFVVSIQFGPMNYCENRDFFKMAPVLDARGHVSCSNAETAVMDPNGHFVSPPWDTNDQVQGWQSPEEVVRLITWAASLTFSGLTVVPNSDKESSDPA